MDELRLGAGSQVFFGSKYALPTSARPPVEDAPVDMVWDTGDVEWDGYNCTVAKAGGRRPLTTGAAAARGQARCQVAGCRNPLQGLKKYYKRHKICEYHMALDRMELDGVPQRFCQQCGRFQPLHLFDGMRRTCRTRLLSHNQRRREMRAAARGDDACPAPPPARRRRANGPARLIWPPADSPPDDTPDHDGDIADEDDDTVPVPVPDPRRGAPSPLPATITVGAAAGAAPTIAAEDGGGSSDEGATPQHSSSGSSGAGARAASRTALPTAATEADGAPGRHHRSPVLVAGRPHLVTAGSASGAPQHGHPHGSAYPPLLSLVRAANTLHPTPTPTPALATQQALETQPRSQAPHAVIKPIPHRIAPPLSLRIQRPAPAVAPQQPPAGPFAAHAPLPSPFVLSAPVAAAHAAGPLPASRPLGTTAPPGYPPHQASSLTTSQPRSSTTATALTACWPHSTRSATNTAFDPHPDAPLPAHGSGDSTSGTRGGAGLLTLHHSLTRPRAFGESGHPQPQVGNPLHPLTRKIDSAPAAPVAHQPRAYLHTGTQILRPSHHDPNVPASLSAYTLIPLPGTTLLVPPIPPQATPAAATAARDHNPPPAAPAPTLAPTLAAPRSSAPRLRPPSANHPRPRAAPASPTAVAASRTPSHPAASGGATATASLPSTPLAPVPDPPSTTGTADSYAASPPPQSSTLARSPSTDHPRSASPAAPTHPSSSVPPPESPADDPPLSYEALELLISFSLKIFNTLPSRLPRNLRAHLHTLASDAFHLEAAIRPGCVHLAVDAFCPALPPPAAPAVPSAAELASRLLPLDTFWAAACLEVQSGATRCRMDRGEIEDVPLGACLGCPMAPACTVALSPLCIHDPAQQPITLATPWRPRNLHAADPRVFFRCAGQYLNPDGELPEVVPGPAPTTALLRFHVPAPPTGGHLVRIEVSAEDGKELLPSPPKVVLVVDTPELAQEISSLERPALRHLARTVLPDLGRVLEAGAALCPPTAPTPAPAPPARTYSPRERHALLAAARQLLHLSNKLQWRHVPAALLPIVAALTSPTPALPPALPAAVPAPAGAPVVTPPHDSSTGTSVPPAGLSATPPQSTEQAHAAPAAPASSRPHALQHAKGSDTPWPPTSPHHARTSNSGPQQRPHAVLSAHPAAVPPAAARKRSPVPSLCVRTNSARLPVRALTAVLLQPQPAVPPPPRAPLQPQPAVTPQPRALLQPQPQRAALAAPLAPRLRRAPGQDRTLRLACVQAPGETAAPAPPASVQPATPTAAAAAGATVVSPVPLLAPAAAPKVMVVVVGSRCGMQMAGACGCAQRGAPWLAVAAGGAAC